MTFESGTPIFSKGDKSDRAFIIQTGRVEIKRSGDRIQDHVGILGPGALFGEVGLLTNEPRLETAVALERTTVELVLKEDFAALYDNCSLEIQKLINALSAKIREVKTLPVPGAEPVAPPPAAPVADNGALAGALDRLATFLEESAKAPKVAVAPAAPVLPDRRVAPPTSAILERKPIDFGPILPLLEDATVNDILINGPDNIFVERHGKLVKSEIVFPNDKAVLTLADQIAESIGRPIDRGRPLVDARLPDGSRVNIIAQPLAVD
ncbi:MAG: Flp pilus assembly complex ATPase component TadA, partial [Alphaproteobacteria bacterium]|nr:Flp pilus assembly complex ATPase component TadA [Alphaproteobacteria bacterium]